jgi:PAS domain-containing protein
VESARPIEDETDADPLLPRTAVCDRHQDRQAKKLVAAADGRGDCYLCLECFHDHGAGGPLPFLRHSPGIRRRAEIPVRRRVGRRRAISRKPGAEARFLQALFSHADISLVLIDDVGRIMAAAGPEGGVLGYVGRPRSGILDFVHPDDLSLAYSQLAEVSERPGQQATLRIRAIHADGSTRNLEVTVVNRLDDPLLRGIVLRSRDVTAD